MPCCVQETREREKIKIKVWRTRFVVGECVTRVRVKLKFKNGKVNRKIIRAYCIWLAKKSVHECVHEIHDHFYSWWWIKNQILIDVRASVIKRDQVTEIKIIRWLYFTIVRISNLIAREMHAFTFKNDKPMRVVYIALIVVNGCVIDFSPVIYYMRIDDCVPDRRVLRETYTRLFSMYSCWEKNKKMKNEKTCLSICFASCCPRLYDSV